MMPFSLLSEKDVQIYPKTSTGTQPNCPLTYAVFNEQKFVQTRPSS